MRKYVFAAALCGLSSCASTQTVQLQGEPLTRPYYITKTAYTFADSTAGRATLHVDDRLMIWLSGMLESARRYNVEPAACLRIASRHGAEFWVDSMTPPPSITDVTDSTVTFACHSNEIPIHGHIYRDGWQCTPSPKDTGPAWAQYLAEALVCGSTIDSVVVWRARKR